MWFCNQHKNPIFLVKKTKNKNKNKERLKKKKQQEVTHPIQSVSIIVKNQSQTQVFQKSWSSQICFDRLKILILILVETFCLDTFYELMAFAEDCRQKTLKKSSAGNPLLTPCGQRCVLSVLHHVTRDLRKISDVT